MMTIATATKFATRKSAFRRPVIVRTASGYALLIAVVGNARRRRRMLAKVITRRAALTMVTAPAGKSAIQSRVTRRLVNVGKANGFVRRIAVAANVVRHKTDALATTRKDVRTTPNAVMVFAATCVSALRVRANAVEPVNGYACRIAAAAAA
jgi:hypothetical protein